MVTPIQSPRIPKIFISIFLLLTLGIGITGFYYYENQKRHIKREKQNELHTICDLKVNQIANWRKERLGDAEAIFKNTLFLQYLRRCLKTREISEIRKEILNWMNSLLKLHDYNSIFLLDAKGEGQLSISDEKESLGPYAQGLVKGVIQSRKVTFLDLYREEKSGHIHIDILVPLVPESNDTLPVGVLLLRIEPNKFFFPFIQSWPTPSPTAESLLVRREGNGVVFLNELRHQKNTALTLRLPIVGKQSVAVRAVQGVEGVLEDMDYRGVKVLAAVRAIPGSPWYLIAKIDLEEIYAPIREHAIFVITLMSALILSAGVIVVFLWRNQNVRFYRKQYENETERRALIQHFEYLTKYANDIILMADRNWKIVEVNERALESYGYTRDELLRMDARNLRSPEERLLFEDQFKKLEEMKGLMLQTIHQKKDGTTFPVEASLRIIEVEGETFYQSIIRDITERKKIEEVLQRNEERFRELYDDAPVAYHELDLEGHITNVNRTELEMMGYTTQEMIGQPVWKFIVEEETSKESILAKMAGNKPPARGLERNFRRKDGTTFPVMIDEKLLKDEKRRIKGIRSTIQDITERKRVEQEREKLIRELQEALVKVKTLSGLVPICASCKKIRDDKGYWNQIESYIEKHSTAEFTHSICPECARKLYPQLYDEEDDGKSSPESSEQK